MNKLLRYVSENVSYYSNLFKESNFESCVKALSDLVSIPILTREVIQNNYANIAIRYKEPKSGKPIELNFELACKSIKDYISQTTEAKNGSR